MRPLGVVLLLCWTVMGSLVRGVDGDTFIARLQIWQELEAVERVRVQGVNAPEIGQPKAAEAAQFTADWLARGPFTVASCGRDKYGRVVGRVTRGADDLGAALIAAGLARRWP